MTKEPSRIAGAAVAMLVALAVLQIPAMAEGEGWKDTAEFSLVSISGNSEGTTFGFKNTLSKAWDRSSFELKAGGVRVETTSKARFATGVNSFGETEFTEKTAENYYLSGRYDRKITDTFFWYTGLGWDRNRFAGLQNRYTAVAGVGNIWFDTDDRKFRTDYALTYTDQEDIFPDPLVSDSFAGVRLSWDYLNKVGENATYTNTLVIDGNLDETSDYRADMINALSVAMSSRLALKLSLQWLYDAEPSIELLQFTDPGPPEVVTQVRAPFDDLDQIFTASLVVNF